MRLIAGVLFLLMTMNASAAPHGANYYRFWQGFKKLDLTTNQFANTLPDFMNATVELYKGKGLNQYFVATPPSHKPSFIPDEFALVAFDYEQSYKFARNTPEGKVYSEKHWELFDKSTSRSAEMKNFSPNTPLTLGLSYNVLAKRNDWTKGYTTFFVGLKKDGISTTTFAAFMQQHVGKVASTFKPFGLKGYLMLLNKNYEVVYMNWSSKEAADKAFQTVEGQEIVKEASDFMTPLQFQEAEKYEGTAKPSSFYLTLED